MGTTALRDAVRHHTAKKILPQAHAASAETRLVGVADQIWGVLIPSKISTVDLTKIGNRVYNSLGFQVVEPLGS